MAIVPGEIPEPREEPPLLAEEPLPPGVGDIAQQIEDLDKKIREGGPEEIEQADEAADAAEGDADDAQERVADTDAGSDSDSDEDPTSDEGADAEDPEAQQG